MKFSWLPIAALLLGLIALLVMFFSPVIAMVIGNVALTLAALTIADKITPKPKV